MDRKRAIPRDCAVYHLTVLIQPAPRVPAELLAAAIRSAQSRAAGGPAPAEPAWEVFGELCDAHIGQCVSRLRLAADEADDCQQGTWIRLVRALCRGRFDPDHGTFEAWVYGIARREAAALRRRRSRDVNRCPSTPVPFECPSPGPDLFCALEATEERERLRRGLDQLRRRLSGCTFRAFELCRIEGHQTAKAAQILHLTPRQVSHRVSWATSELRKILGEPPEIFVMLSDTVRDAAKR
jgi:RNA polymerase sigma factor (sigma-70 family)